LQQSNLSPPETFVLVLRPRPPRSNPVRSNPNADNTEAACAEEEKKKKLPCGKVDPVLRENKGKVKEIFSSLEMKRLLARRRGDGDFEMKERKGGKVSNQIEYNGTVVAAAAAAVGSGSGSRKGWWCEL
jgi:hypothetical protein